MSVMLLFSVMILQYQAAVKHKQLPFIRFIKVLISKRAEKWKYKIPC